MWSYSYRILQLSHWLPPIAVSSSFLLPSLNVTIFHFIFNALALPFITCTWYRGYLLYASLNLLSTLLYPALCPGRGEWVVVHVHFFNLPIRLVIASIIQKKKKKNSEGRNRDKEEIRSSNGRDIRFWLCFSKVYILK